MTSAFMVSKRLLTPRSRAFSRVMCSAPSDRSIAVTRASSTVCAAAMPMQPEQQHKSRIRGETRSLACSITSSHRRSVSERGMSTERSTLKVRP